MSRIINRKSCQFFSGFLRAKVLKNKTRTTNPKEFFDKSEKRKIREANTKLAVKLAMAPAISRQLGLQKDQDYQFKKERIMFSNPNYQTINLSFEESHEKSALDVLALFRKLKANNEKRLSRWNITPGSDIAIKMNWTFVDKQTNELKICSAPAFSILVKGAAFEGGIIVLKDRSGKYKVLLFGLNHKMIEQKPVSEKQLLDFLDKLINVNPIFPMSS